MKILLENKELRIDENTTYLDLAEKIYGKNNKVGVIGNNSFKYLEDYIEDKESLSYIDKYSKDAKGIMQRTLILIFVFACKNLYKNKTVQIEHSIGEYIYCELKGGKKLLHTDIQDIKVEMQRIIDADYKIYRKMADKKHAIDLLKKEGYEDKVLLFENLDIDYINYYEVNNKIFTFHGYLAPTTGCIEKFDILSYYPGVVITVPTYKTNKQISKFKEEKILAKIFANSKRWTELLNVGNAGNLNKYIKDGNIKFIIDTSEAYFENQISNIADRIVLEDGINLIQIAGPSSSGKTTSAYRLSVQLGVRGKRPILISTDDYFVNRDKTPINEYGEKDYEMLEAIDLPRFNEDLMSLMEGETIELPSFNFITGKREKSGKRIKLQKDSIIIIEGLHCLNPKLTELVPEKNKFKIYISALTQLNIDNHNKISTSRVRLLRRMIRDN